MHAIKVSWVGQTFALAKCSDSGGKKSRIRRSKEERKTMVESFIKKYQNSNNGNFPSLNLTHKEVGGSFYTVRELVREIIQENRVLGPAKLTPEEHNVDRLSEQYPLGSISTEPQGHFPLSTNETRFFPNNHQSTSEELVSTSSGQSTVLEEKSFNDGGYINGNWVNEEYKESDARKFSEQGGVMIQVDDEPLHTKVQVGEKLNGAKNVVEASTAKVTPIAADVVVETFPLKSATKTTHCTDGSSDEASELNGTLEEKQTKNMEVAPGNSGPVLDKMDSLEKNSVLVNDKAVANLADPLLESSSLSITRKSITSKPEGTDLQVNISHDDVLTMEISDQNQAIAEIEPKIAPNDIHTKNSSSANVSSSRGESISREAVGIKDKADIQHSGSAEEGSNSTLNRINLESWEGASKKSPGPETNPVWEVFKAFINAFVKFWSE
ncbi:hypothetical protein HHK36_019260 [Tetracentron sinense]|uniref:AT3G52170-like helix-turn-helix domain-containing protein n=1 Tax=Tetracentron sinense TaxID=13715 RepID=A0A834Z1Y1_TETSI|nr:hypothetical protein HHK36_019260 [Tetracentron sinense]